ncbi:hypothetical protein BN1723_013498 [Verticillium longisporum]|uniref:Uncharacterized protein n=1 Tax=Verticillium longisporum TaxID=100787 RepID=A0A0G4LT44_VERLO|nr:hypothetical protein BN1723_013498 [Verticillium longisporum]
MASENAVIKALMSATTKHWGRKTFVHLQRLGILSLASLFVGGSVLIDVGRRTTDEGAHNDAFKILRPGAHLGVQVWLAILGVGFGLLAYGFHEAYNHFFDWTCTRMAQSAEGLNYGRYLNSLPRAPVSYGFRGFPWLITFRNIVIISGTAASVGYKFAIREVPDSSFSKALPQEQVILQPPPLQITTNGTVAPWLADTHNSETSRSFLHGFRNDDPEHRRDPPSIVVMMATSNCNWNIQLEDQGNLYEREFVLIANQSTHQDQEPPPAMPREAPDGWRRMRTANSDWPAGSGDQWDNANRSQAVVDYRIGSSQVIEMRWAPAELWDNPTSSSTESIPAARHLTYEVRYAVRNAQRTIQRGDCATMKNVLDFVNSYSTTAEDLLTSLLSVDDEAPQVREQQLSFSEHHGPWIDALLQLSDTTSADVASTFLRLALTYIASEAMGQNYHVGHVPLGETPFGPEPGFSQNREGVYMNIWRKNGSVGCHYVAAKAFIALGCLAILVGLTRIVIGPPQLTSWIGQHLYMHQANGTSLLKESQHDEELERLSTGYEVAGRTAGTLRL